MELALRRRTLRFRTPLPTAHGTLTERELVEVTLTAADGTSGTGEAAPLHSYDGVPLDAVVAGLEACRALLRDADEARVEEVLAACREAAGTPQALAALDLALWDRAARRVGRPVAALLADDPAASVTVNATIGALAPGEAGTVAGRAVDRGFRCLKVKVGAGDDVARIAAVRAAAGPGVGIRVDANGAWTVEEAAVRLRALAPAGIEMAEEPVSGVDALRALRRHSPVALAMDETAAEPGAIASGAADLVCLKISSCGGISAVLAAAAQARAAGSEIYLASAFDGPAGIAAALHAAAALHVRRACGLATLALFSGVEDPFPPHGGTIAVPDRPGLGLGAP